VRHGLTYPSDLSSNLGGKILKFQFNLKEIAESVGSVSSQLDTRRYAHMDFKLTDEQKKTLLSTKWVRDEVDKMQAKAARSPSQLRSTIMKQEPEADATDDVMLLHYVETKVYRVSGRVECNQGRRCFKRSSETMNYRTGWFDFGELPYYVQSDIDKEGYKILLFDFSDEEEQDEEEDEDQQLSLYQLVLIKTQDA